MTELEDQWLESAQSAEEPAAEQGSIDLDALTDAVERLLCRDLEIQRERLRGGGRA